MTRVFPLCVHCCNSSIHFMSLPTVRGWCIATKTALLCLRQDCPCYCHASGDSGYCLRATHHFQFPPFPCRRSTFMIFQHLLGVFQDATTFSQCLLFGFSGVILHQARLPRVMHGTRQGAASCGTALLVKMKCTGDVCTQTVVFVHRKDVPSIVPCSS